MNPSFLQKELSSNLIRQGHLFKRSKFLKAWQDRWLVLTVNYLFIFQDRSRKSLTDSIDLNEVRNYKSYVRKDDDVLTNCIKIRTESNMYYLGFGSVLEKWTWLVSLERLMDVKVAGKSHYNCQEWIASRGFPSVTEFNSKPEKQQVDQAKSGNKIGNAQSGEDFEQMRRQFEERQHSYEAALREKYKQLNVIEQKMKLREKEYQELSAQLKSAMQDADRKVKHAQAKVVESQSRVKVAELIAKNAEADKEVVRIVKVENKQENEENHGEKIQRLTIENGRLRGQLSVLSLKLEQQKTSFDGQLSQIQKILKEKQETIRVLSLQNQQLSHKIQKIQEKTIQNITKIEQKAHVSVVQSQSKGEQIHKLSKQIQNLNERITSLTSNEQKSKKQIETLRNQLSDLKTQYQNLKQYNESAVKQAQKNFFESEGLKKSLSEMNNIKETLKAELALLSKRLIQYQKMSLEKAAEKAQSAQVAISANEELLKIQVQVAQTKLQEQRTKVKELTLENENLRRQIKEKTQRQISLIAQFEQITKLNAELSAKKQESPRKALPETGHIIHEAHQYDLIQSMLGYGLSPQQRKNVHIKATIHRESSPAKKQRQRQSPNKVAKIQRQSPSHSKVDAVETILGYTIPPHKHSEIHTEGIVLIKVEKENSSQEAKHLFDKVQSLIVSNNLLREELQVVKKASSFQKQLFAAQRQRYEKAHRESEERHIREKQQLAEKLKQYQSLHSEFQTKLSSIQAQPVAASPRKEEKQTQGVSTEILRPSLLKTKSTTESVPAWVKVREEQKPVEPQQRQEEQVPSDRPRVSRVHEMKKLFENMSSSKKE